MAKNAGETVAALLRQVPPPPRAQKPTVPAVEPDQAEEHVHKIETRTESAPPAAAATVAPARSHGEQRPRPSAESSAPTESTAPPTLRLSQPTAEALRAAWLTAKRDRVLLTYQDFAGEIITAGLRNEERAPTVEERSASPSGSPVPRTLRLAPPTAETLRTAWLTAKRDRVLLTYQDFAGEIITAGLQQPRQHPPQQ